jgi:hypothetical protein
MFLFKQNSADKQKEADPKDFSLLEIIDTPTKNAGHPSEENRIIDESEIISDWEKRESRQKRGVFFYYNLTTGESITDKEYHLRFFLNKETVVSDKDLDCWDDVNPFDKSSPNFRGF